MRGLDSTGVGLADEQTVFAHGHTLVINSLVERRGAKVGLVTTKGFKDVLDVGYGSRPETYNLRYRRDPVLVPPQLRFEISERAYVSGKLTVAPTQEELETLVVRLRRAKLKLWRSAF